MSDATLDLVALRRMALTLILGTIWLQPVLIVAACLAYGVSFLAPVGTALAIVCAAQAAAYLDREGGQGRVVAGVSLMALISILVVGSSRVDLQACKLEYSIVSPK